jgi:hypothetical protein
VLRVHSGTAAAGGGRYSDDMPPEVIKRIRDLSELIAALDRRVLRVDRAGEASIARAAAKLKDEALKRIADLEHKRLR